MTKNNLLPRENNTKHIALWLFACCAMVVAMIVIGAITRLTESGLSIVDWHGVKDMLPPLNDAAWAEKFAEYKTSPEYRLKNSGMELTAFKSIYFWEWFHRLWGRLLGLVYAVPLLYFWIRNKIPSHLKLRFVGFLILGGAQGALGWYMVKSGLINEPRVSHFRLAAHLSLALLLLALLWLQALALWPNVASRLDAFETTIARSLRTHTQIAFALLLGTLIWGAFTAGLDAGLACSDFPKTCAQWIPQELFFQGRFFYNIFHEPTAVQFMHRVWGTLTFLILFSLGIRLLKSKIPELKKPGLILHLLIFLQWMLGIGAVHSHVAVPVAAMHQFGAVMTLMTLLYVGFFVLKKNQAAKVTIR